MLEVPSNERELLAVALASLGERHCLSRCELDVCKGIDPYPGSDLIDETERLIRSGSDPLGDWYGDIHSPQKRRKSGTTFTPLKLVNTVLEEAALHVEPSTVIDTGAGTGRFTVAACRAFPEANVLAVENDPVKAVLTRANLRALGIDKQARVVVRDFRELDLGDRKGATLFTGNPPYVRHHDIEANWKRWYARCWKALGQSASTLAGLHMHFFVKVLSIAQQGDVCAFLTSAEWLDVNYGRPLRDHLARNLDLRSVALMAPDTSAFEGTLTTSSITVFKIASPSKEVCVSTLLAGAGNLTSENAVLPKARLLDARKWTPHIVSRKSQARSENVIQLGELFRVHRGQVTGMNMVWVTNRDDTKLPQTVLFKAVTKARDLIEAGRELTDDSNLRYVIDLPVNLDDMNDHDRLLVEEFLKWAEITGVKETYTSKHRKPWYRVGLRPPAPILVSYMGRRPPVFTRNLCHARHINIAHGLYPRVELNDDALAGYVSWLNENVTRCQGRTYSGGLTKFEPKEIERLLVPQPEHLPSLMVQDAAE